MRFLSRQWKPMLVVISAVALVLSLSPAARAAGAASAASDDGRLFQSFAEDAALVRSQWWEGSFEFTSGQPPSDGHLDMTALMITAAFQPLKGFEFGGKVGFGSTSADDDLPERWRGYVQLNAELSRKWPRITEKREAPPDAEHWKGVAEKRAELDLGVAGRDDLTGWGLARAREAMYDAASQPAPDPPWPRQSTRTSSLESRRNRVPGTRRWAARRSGELPLDLGVE